MRQADQYDYCELSMRVTDQVGLLVVIAGHAFDPCAVNCYPIDLACGGVMQTCPREINPAIVHL